jgi:hypothetical protein
VLPASFIPVPDLTSGAGGLAAAIAVGAFIGQSLSGLWPASEQKRRRDTAVGGFAGLMAMIGLILLAANGW